MNAPAAVEPWPVCSTSTRSAGTTTPVEAAASASAAMAPICDRWA